MKRLLPLTITLLPLFLTACDEQSDSYPADGRDFDAQAYVAGTPYTGKVIDGYLRNARVWLDMDGDGQYTPGPLSLESPSGTELVLSNGEPTAMTVEDGEFSLDVSELEQEPLVAPDLDPRDYPLFALALPGKTQEQTPSGPRVLDQGFMLSAPPGVRNITPLTTLIRQRRVNGISEFLVGTSDLALALGNINLVSDYVRAGDARAHTYARAFARFLASQLPQDYKDILREPDSDGRERFLSAEAVKLMGISFARNALSIVRIVDEAAAGDYASVDVDSLNLPQIELELDDSMIVTGQTVFARAGGGLPSSFSALDPLAEISLNYSESGRLTSVVANGCMSPSLREMVRVINADGKIAATGTQWVPNLSLKQQGGTFYDEAGIDERLTFDWKNGTAAFETTTSCHDHLAASSELGGPAAIDYKWTLSDGKVTSLTATSGGKTEVITPAYDFGSGFFFGYTRTVNGLDEEVVQLSSEEQTCEGDITTVDADKPQVVSAFLPYTVSGSLTIPSGFTGLRLGLELDTRDGLNRPLRFGFLNEEFRTTEGVSNTGGFEWRFYYPGTGTEDFVGDQPNLIQTAYLTRYDGTRDCGRSFGSVPVSAYARVVYSYQSLSRYLAGQVDGQAD